MVNFIVDCSKGRADSAHGQLKYYLHYPDIEELGELITDLSHGADSCETSCLMEMDTRVITLYYA